MLEYEGQKLLTENDIKTWVGVTSVDIHSNLLTASSGYSSSDLCQYLSVSDIDKAKNNPGFVQFVKW